MTDIAPIGHLHGTSTSLNGTPPVHANGTASPAGAARGSDEARSAAGPAQQGAEAMRSRDRIEISGHARLLDQLRQMPEVRQDRIEAARLAIAKGAYETPDRLDAAVERLLDDIWA